MYINHCFIEKRSRPEESSPPPVAKKAKLEVDVIPTPKKGRSTRGKPVATPKVATLKPARKGKNAPKATPEKVKTPVAPKLAKNKKAEGNTIKAYFFSL